jgi:hypothetical protein
MQKTDDFIYSFRFLEYVTSCDYPKLNKPLEYLQITPEITSKIRVFKS